MTVHFIMQGPFAISEKKQILAKSSERGWAERKGSVVLQIKILAMVFAAAGFNCNAKLLHSNGLSVFTTRSMSDIASVRS